MSLHYGNAQGSNAMLMIGGVNLNIVALQQLFNNLCMSGQCCTP
jgi:hypothetical protein